MTQWWAGLNQRERRILIIGAIVVSIALIYLLLVEPFVTQVKELDASVSEQTELLQWMQVSEQQVAMSRAKTGSGKSVAAGGGSLLALVDQTAKRSKLGDAIKRVEPEGGQGVRLWLEQASFDNILLWLAKIKQSDGVEVSRISIEQPDSPGIVNARVSLQRGGQ
ncbi:MAG: type II secretion system protein M [Gammaproteobacteria bacterium]|nr:type II secretion system protein M [Gammaproteobacteria bacterium]